MLSAISLALSIAALCTIAVCVLIEFDVIKLKKQPTT